jgi:hypothetical protein
MASSDLASLILWPYFMVKSIVDRKRFVQFKLPEFAARTAQRAIPTIGVRPIFN